MENIWQVKEKNTEKEKEKNNWRRKMLGLLRRRKVEKEKDESIFGKGYFDAHRRRTKGTKRRLKLLE